MAYELDDERRQYILGLVESECTRAIGFDDVNSGELTAQRERALQYAKGDMPDLIPDGQGRSRAVSTDVADAIETVLPDLIDIFTGSEDVITFEPMEENDVETAKQESDYLYHVVFQKNNGWSVYYDAFKDALTCKTGVLSWRWEGDFEPPSEYHESKTLSDLLYAQQSGVVEDLEPAGLDEQGQPLVNYTLKSRAAKGRMVIEAIPSEDLAVAPDTTCLKTATYCAVRQRPRAQDLIAMGFDPEIINTLPPWADIGDSPEAQARDTVGESENIGEMADAMRQVEIYRHYIRLYDEGKGKLCLYQVITGGKGFTGTLIDIQEVPRIQLAAITPYKNPHRFYGESVADKLIEIQRIKTLLTRAKLDSTSFSLNQRMEVAEDSSTADTLADLLNNSPGMPVRVRRAGTISPIQSGGLNYDPLADLEYFSTVSEGRTGIVRNAQGLNPDTLHDTKGGLEILANNALKRVRMIARSFAETGIKDFLLGLHASIREQGSSMSETVRLRGKQWVPIDPSTWRTREDMTIQIGVGAGGREHDILVGQQILALQEKAYQAQGGIEGPLVNPKNFYALSQFLISRLGVKTPEVFISNPDEYQAPAPQPDPAQMEAQAKAELEQQKLQLEAQKAQAQLQLKQAEAEMDMQLQQQKIEVDMQLAREKAAMEMQIAREKAEMEAQLARERAALEAQLAQERAELQAAVSMRNEDAKIGNSVRMGGEVG